MPAPFYAVVSYLRSPLSSFIDKIRKQLNSRQPHLRAHVTLLPPRMLQGDEAAAMSELRSACAAAAPIEVSLGAVDTFLPNTPTVYLRVEEGDEALCALHARLNVGSLQAQEEWPYVPHITLAQALDYQETQFKVQQAQTHWSHYSHEHGLRVTHLTLVRELAHGEWLDVLTVNLDGGK